MKRKYPLIVRYRFLLIIFIIFTITAVSVSAHYIKKADVTNRFSSAESKTPPISESFDGEVKEDVSFGAGDTGYPVYVRATVVVTWQNSDGIVFFSNPVEDEDYVLDLNLDSTGTGWIKGEGGYYYYQTPVKSSEETDALINKCEPKAGSFTPVGYTLNVEILVQTVQAIGTTDNTEIPAYQDAWGIASGFGTDSGQQP